MTDDFTTFVAQVQRSMHRLAVALTGGDLQEAEDLVQASLERVWTRWGELTIERPVPYARTVLVREFSSLRRRARWRRETLYGHVPDSIEVEELKWSAEGLMLFRALARLPRRQREVIVLRYLEDLSVAEVSELLSRSEGTIKRSAYDGIRSLRSAFEQSPEEE